MGSPSLVRFSGLAAASRRCEGNTVLAAFMCLDRMAGGLPVSPAWSR